MNKFEEIINQKFLNKDGSLNKTVLVSAITLLIVLVDQILAIFNVFPAHQDQVVAILNTLLTILSIFGFVEGPDTAQIINPQTPQEPRNANVSITSPKVAPDTIEHSQTNANLAKIAMKNAQAPTALGDAEDSKK